MTPLHHADAPLSDRCHDGCVYEFGAEWCAAFDVPCIDHGQDRPEADPAEKGR